MLKLLPLLLLLTFSGAGQAQSIEDEALDWLQAFIQIDTINPPGNESRAVSFLAGILEAEGIPYQTAESAPGRGNHRLLRSDRLFGRGRAALVPGAVQYLGPPRVAAGQHYDGGGAGAGRRSGGALAG